MADLPEIRITASSAWCSRHLAPYRARWPHGYLHASVCLVHQAVHTEQVMAACTGRDERGVNAVLREYGPLCCLVGDEVVAAITAMALDDDTEQLHALLVKYGPPPQEGKAP